jgi:hypothetical protein
MDGFAEEPAASPDQSLTDPVDEPDESELLRLREENQSLQAELEQMQALSEAAFAQEQDSLDDFAVRLELGDPEALQALQEAARNAVLQTVDPPQQRTAEQLVQDAAAMIASHHPDWEQMAPRLRAALERHPEWVAPGLQFGDPSLVAVGLTNAIQAIRIGDQAQESSRAAKLQAQTLSGGNGPRPGSDASSAWRSALADVAKDASYSSQSGRR